MHLSEPKDAAAGTASSVGADGATVSLAPPSLGSAAHRAARNAAAVAAAEISGKVATLAYTIAAARTLGPDDFGVFAYAVSFSLLVATIPAWGFDPILVQRGSADPAKIRVLFSETLTWRTALAVPVFGAAALAGFATRPDSRSAVALLVVLAASMVDVYGDAGRSAAAALERQGGTSKAFLVQRISTAILAISALVLGFGVIGLCLAYLAGSLIGIIGVAVALRRLGVGFDLRSVNREGMARTGRLSVAIGLDTVVSLLLFRVDQVILGALKGDAAVGEYAAAYRLLETVLFLSWAVGRAVLPSMSSRPDGRRVGRGFEQAVAAVALVYVPFGVLLLMEAEPAIRLLYGSAYAAAGAPIARWLAPAPLLFAMSYLGAYALLAQDRRWAMFGTSFAAAAFNVGANFLLIPSLSGTGAAIATTTSFGVETVATLALLVPAVGWIRLDRALVLPAVASAAMAVAVATLRTNVLVEAAVGGVVYLGVWYVLARWRSPDQLAIIRSVIPWRR